MIYKVDFLKKMNTIYHIINKKYNMNKIAIISDLHLKENDRTFFKEKREELIIREINNIINNEEIKHVVLNWDTLNESKVSISWYVINLLREKILYPLLKANKKIHILLWNHERNNTWDTYNFLKEITNPNIKIYSEIEEYDFEDFIGVFVPFLYPSDFWVSNVPILARKAEKYLQEKILLLKEKYNKPVIVFNHNIMTKWLPFDNGREVNIPIMEFEWVDFVFWWHIHKHEVFNKWMYVWSFMKSFVYEEETEWYIIFEVKEWKVNYQNIKIESFNYEKITINEVKTFDFETIKENTVYDLVVYFDVWTEDDFFISDLTKVISSKNSFIKKQQILTKDIEMKKNIVTGFYITNEEVLEEYLTNNWITGKEKKKSYFEKLKICEEMWKVKHSQIKVNKKVEEDVINSLKTINDLSGIIRNDRVL